MTSERDELAKALFVTDNHKAEDADAEWEFLQKHPKYLDAYHRMANAVLSAGYKKPPAKVKGNTPLGRIRELMKQLDRWESQGHKSAGTDYLRRHFKDVL